MLRDINRWNDPVSVNDGANPMRLIHLALNIPKEGHQKAIDFYVERLKFRPTDVLKDAGTFMHCEGDVEHHNFFLCHRPDFSGFNHCAVEVRNFDELVKAGNHMINQKWDESRTLGRHLVGSNLYRFFHSPAGGRLEFASDMDRMDDNFETRIHEKTPGHHIWSMKTHGKAGV